MIRLYNDDCLNVLRTEDIPPNSVIVTDPPFNIGYNYNSYSDRKREEEYLKWLADIIGDRPCVIIHYPEMLYKIAFHLRRMPERVLAWVYNSNTARQHRDIAYFGVKPNMKQMTQPYKNPTDKRIKARIEAGFKGAAIYDWMNINQVKNVTKKKDGITHPCTMPLEVMLNVVGVLPHDSVIIDPFMGGWNYWKSCKRTWIFIHRDRD